MNRVPVNSNDPAPRTGGPGLASVIALLFLAAAVMPIIYLLGATPPNFAVVAETDPSR